MAGWTMIGSYFRVPELELVGRLRAANTRLRELLTAKDAEVSALLSAKDREAAELRESVRVLTLRVAELERQRGSGSDDSGTPTSKESIAAKPQPFTGVAGVAPRSGSQAF